MGWSIRVLIFAFVLSLLVNPTMAQVYDNGPINGNTDAWTINFGFAVSDSFTTGGGQIGGLQFGAWLFPGDVLESVEVLITSSRFGGTTFFDQTVNFTQSSNCPTNQYGYEVCTESGSFITSPLAAGTFWLTLRNGVVNDGDPVYWDENSGPSQARQSAGGLVPPNATNVGTIPSESFTVLGCTCCGAGECDTSSSTPEPGTITLAALGLLTLSRSGVLRLVQSIARRLF